MVWWNEKQKVARWDVGLASKVLGPSTERASERAQVDFALTSTFVSGVMLLTSYHLVVHLLHYFHTSIYVPRYPLDVM